MLQKKVAFVTLGCKVNLYDTEAMTEIFKNKGYEVVDFNEFSDIYVINTCTVTNLGDKKSRQMIRRAKKSNPDATIVACGCYAQVAPDEVSAIEGINIVIGTKNRSSIVEIIEGHQNKTSVYNGVENIMKENIFENLQISELRDRTRAYLKIQEGCNCFCSYCIIPFARGPIRSRQPNEILAEVKRLAANGFKEIVLTGIHIASYGIDLTEDLDLIKIINCVHEINGIERIRFSSIEPRVVTDEFIDMIKACPKVCHHLHLSLQSGCDKTLKKMNRNYTSSEYMNAVNKLRDSFPDICITTDLIVGFPDETEEDFILSYNFAEKVKLSKIHVFPYSPKNGTAAAKFKNQISKDVKTKRVQKMLDLSEKLEKDFFNEFLDSTPLDVLFETKDGNIYEGHTSNYIKVRVESDVDIVNQVLPVKLLKIVETELVYGEIVY